MRGFPFIPGSMGLEILMFPTNCFTRAIRSRFYRPDAIGQVEVERGTGRILWVADFSSNEKPLLPDLLDNLAVEAGLRGIQTLIASTHKENYAFECLLNAGYTPITFKNVWNFQPKSITDGTKKFSWRRAHSYDLYPISLFQNKILSRPEKIITPPVNDIPPGFVLAKNDVVCGYAHVVVNQKQMLITPVIDPGKDPESSALNNLVTEFFGQQRIIYLVQSSSQQWIEKILDDQITLALPRQEIMVKFLAVRDEQRAADYLHSRRNQHTDIVTPSINSD
jgi:hypothetical protein